MTVRAHAARGHAHSRESEGGGKRSGTKCLLTRINAKNPEYHKHTNINTSTSPPAAGRRPDLSRGQQKAAARTDRPRTRLLQPIRERANQRADQSESGNARDKFGAVYGERRGLHPELTQYHTLMTQSDALGCTLSTTCLYNYNDNNHHRKRI